MSPSLDPILIPKLVQNLLIFGPILDPFFLGFRSSLRFSWEASRAKKCRQSPAKTTFLKMQLFGSLKLLMALLGSSCPLFGRSGPKMGPKMVPKRGPKSDQKMVHKIIPDGPKKPPTKVAKRRANMKKKSL